MLKDWILNKHKESNAPLLIAVSGAQGSGKSTVCRKLTEELNEAGIKTVTVSVDDFYLTREEQQKLTDSTDNPYLQMRGYPGTHDLELATHVLKALKDGNETFLPVYDKSKFNGLGDRSEMEKWPRVRTPQNIILFEGWFLGFEPQENIEDQNLIEVNENLKNYSSLFSLFDELIYLKPKNLEDVVGWRIEAEQNMRARGLEAMTDEEAKNYVELFLPAYRTYRDSVKASLELSVDSNRRF